MPDDPATVPACALTFFNEVEAITVEAIAARIIPSGPTEPGASEARAITFIDRALTGFDRGLQSLYRRALPELDDACIARHGRRFVDLTEQQQDAILTEVASSLGADTRVDDKREAGSLLERFFAAVREHTMQGTYGDPAYGGNHDGAGWMLIGFPGAQWEYTEEQMRPGFDASTIPIVTLADLRRDRATDGRSHSRATGAPVNVLHHDTRKVDAIIVGLGAVGGIVAEQLAAAGMRVLALEKGPRYSDEDFVLKHDEIRYFARGAMVPQLATDPVTWRAAEGQTARLLPWATSSLGTGDPLHLPPSIGTGGGTIHWGGAEWRLRAADFRMRSALSERWGPKALPEGTAIADWPMTYDDLEPYYDRVEWELGISGQAGNINGELISGGNPFEMPRQRAFPMPPLRQGPGNDRFAEAVRRLGYHPFPQAAAIASVPFQGRAACTYCGFCHGYPCHVGAKQSSLSTSIPRAEATGNLEIRPFARVFRVNRTADGRRATGVSYFDPDGVAHDVTAPRVILACYALENTRLLLVSRINDNGLVGRNFMTHVFGWFTGVMPEYTNPFMGPLVGASIIDDLTSEIVPDNDEGVLWGSPLTSFPGDTQPLEAIHNLPPHIPRWGQGFKDWFARSFRRLYSMHTQTATLPSGSFYCDLDPAIRDPFGQPALRITHDWAPHDIASLRYFSGVKRRIAAELGMLETWEEPLPPAYHISTHEAGTHRMGVDPAASVVDPYGASHEVTGLWVLGGGQLPTLPSYNPTQTLQALAYLTSDRMLDRV